MEGAIKPNRILRKYSSIQEVLLDKDLAGLGDVYINFVHSLALSQKLSKPTRAKVNNRILADAIRKSGFRKKLPRRTDRHAQGDAAEALIVYAWLQDILDFEECLRIMRKGENPTEAFTELLVEIGKRLSATDE